METAHMEHVLDQTKPDFMDAPNSNYFDAISSLDYLQYPHSPFNVGNLGCECLYACSYHTLS